MKKRVLAILLLALFSIAMLTSVGVCAINTHPLDVGNYNDYGGGGGGGGDYGGGGGGYDYGGGGNYYYDSDSSDGDGGGLGLGFSVFVVIVIIIISIVASSKKSNIGKPTNGGIVPADHDLQIVPAIQSIDPNFSRDGFIAWSKETFITLQQAWTARDWSAIRPFEKEELFRQHELQLQEYINNGKINIIERINIRQAFLHLYVRDEQYEYLTVYMSTRMVDYIIDEKTRAVLKGDPNIDCYMDYLLTFMRKTGVKTKDANGTIDSKSCPHCGAPLQITSAGKCEYCNSIVTTGEFDWVLAEMNAVKPGISINNAGVIIKDNGNTPNANNNGSQPTNGPTFSDDNNDDKNQQ